MLFSWWLQRKKRKDSQKEKVNINGLFVSGHAQTCVVLLYLHQISCYVCVDSWVLAAAASQPDGFLTGLAWSLCNRPQNTHYRQRKNSSCGLSTRYTDKILLAPYFSLTLYSRCLFHLHLWSNKINKHSKEKTWWPACLLKIRMIKCEEFQRQLIKLEVNWLKTVSE